MTTADEPGGGSLGTARKVLGQLIDLGAAVAPGEPGRAAITVIEGDRPIPNELRGEAYSNRHEIRELLTWDRDTADRLLIDAVQACQEVVDPDGPEVVILGEEPGLDAAYEQQDMFMLRAFLRQHVQRFRERQGGSG